jgi:cell division transport system permease protein
MFAFALWDANTDTLLVARDQFIAAAFVRRFTVRALAGAVVGTLAGMAAVSILPSADASGGFLTGLGFEGWGWLMPLALPPMAGVVAFAATRTSAKRKLQEWT